MSSKGLNLTRVPFQVIIFGVFLASSALWYDSELLDTTLFSRFFVGFSGLVILFISLNQAIRKHLSEGLTLVDLLIWLFVLWQFLSITWSTNVSEGIADALKSALFLGAFVFVKALLHHQSSWLGHIYVVLALLSIVYHLILVYLFQNLSNEIGLTGQTVYGLHYPSGGKNLSSIALIMLLPFNWLSFKQFRAQSFRFVFLGNILLGIVLLYILSTRAVSVGVVVASLFWVLLEFKRDRKVFLRRFVVGVTILSLGIGLYFFSQFFRVYGIKEAHKVTEKASSKSEALIIEHAKSGSTNERLQIWVKTWEIIQQEPILGVGAGNWKIEFPRNGLDGLIRAQFYNYSINRPHNDLLWIWSEFGFIGLILFQAPLLILFYKSWGSKLDPDLVLLWFTLIVYLVSSFFDFPRERAEHTLFFAIVIGLISTKVGSKTVITGKGLFHTFGFVLLVAMLFLGSIVYHYRWQGEKYYANARVAKYQNQFAETIEHAAQARSVFYTLDHVNFPIQWYSAISHAYLNDVDQALTQFKSALKDNPHNYHTINNIGYCLVQKRKYAEAVLFFERCLAINAYFEEARYNLSYTLAMLQKYDEAKNQLDFHIKDGAKKKLFLKEIDKLQGD